MHAKRHRHAIHTEIHTDRPAGRHVHTYTCVDIHTGTQTHLRTCKHTDIYTYTCTGKPMHMKMHMQVCRHTHIHTQSYAHGIHKIPQLHGLNTYTHTIVHTYRLTHKMWSDTDTHIPTQPCTHAPKDIIDRTECSSQMTWVHVTGAI